MEGERDQDCDLIPGLLAWQLALHRGQRSIPWAGRANALARTGRKPPTTLSEVLDNAAHLGLKSVFEQGKAGLLLQTQDRPQSSSDDLLMSPEVGFRANQLIEPRLDLLISQGPLL